MLLNYTQNFTYIQDARSAMYYALVEWQTSFNITFIETTEIKNADIKLSFQSGDHGDYYNFDGPGGVLAHAYYPHETTHRGVVHLDADEYWDYEFLYCVILHELGHTFGLGHSSVKEAVMAPFYHGASKLHEDDRNGIGDLYGLKSKFGPITPYRAKPGGPQSGHPSNRNQHNTTSNPQSTERPFWESLKDPVYRTTTTRAIRPARTNSTYKLYSDGRTINIYNSHVQITR